MTNSETKAKETSTTNEKPEIITQVTEERLELKKIIEAILLTAGKPLSQKQLLAMFNENEEIVTIDELKFAIAEIESDCETRGVELKRIASGYEMQVKAKYSPYIAKMWEERPARYSKALFETIALIAYKQPITRGEIEEVRGVSISPSIFKTLQDDRGWIRVVGHRDVPGRPALYATTRGFLDYFNVKGLEDLPSLPEIAKLATDKDIENNLEMELESEVAKQSDNQNKGQILSEEDTDSTDANIEVDASLGLDTKNDIKEEDHIGNGEDSEELEDKSLSSIADKYS